VVKRGPGVRGKSKGVAQDADLDAKPQDKVIDKILYNEK
jgi:hypothetical protein